MAHRIVTNEKKNYISVWLPLFIFRFVYCWENSIWNSNEYVRALIIKLIALYRDYVNTVQRKDSLVLREYRLACSRIPAEKVVPLMRDKTILTYNTETDLENIRNTGISANRSGQSGTIFSYIQTVSIGMLNIYLKVIIEKNRHSQHFNF